jgi:hypothetical protein
VLVLAVAGVPAYTAHSLAQELQELVAQPETGALQLRDLVHQAGYLSSQGSVTLQWRAPCDGPAHMPPTRVKLAYQFSHVPGWEFAGHLRWTATPEGEAGAALRQIMAGTGQLSGQGELRYSGLLQTRIDLPALTFEASGTTVHVDPSRGSLALCRNALQLDWTLDRLAQDAPAALEISQMQLALDLDNRSQGTGRLVLRAQQLATAQLTLQDVELRSETRLIGERLSATLSESAQSVRLPGQTLNDLKLELSATGLHASSLQRLAALYAQSCGLRTLDEASSGQLRAALRQLLAAGFSLGVPTLQGRSAGGSLDAQLQLQLLPAPNGAPAAVIRASAHPRRSAVARAKAGRAGQRLAAGSVRRTGGAL